ncbi:MAG: DUF721 domain-containing protein [Nitrospirae bacterium]|nr:DUF721 domain-containing protein [Nitrospirota bacterium]
MQSLQNILNTFIKDYGIEGGVALNAIRIQWDKLVGQAVAAHTFPDTIKNKVITLIVDTPQWLHHLGFFKEEIITKLKPYNISEIRFRIGRLPEKTKEKQETQDNELSEDDLRFLENTLKGLKDEELKEKFRTLIVHGLKRGKK